MKKTKLYFNKQGYLGMGTLDLSKTLMYDYRYNYFITEYGDDARLFFTGTDSLANQDRREEVRNNVHLQLHLHYVSK